MSIPVVPVNTVLGTAGTQGWCGDGRTICQGGGYGAQWDQQRGMNFGKGFSDGVGNQSGGGFPVMPILIILIGLAAFVFYRAGAKSIPPKEYALGKFKILKEKFSEGTNIAGTRENSSEIIEKAVNKFKEENEALGGSASYIYSSIVGRFVAIRDMDGKLLAEMPVAAFKEN